MQKVDNVIIISNCIAINMWLKLKLLGTTPSSARISPDPVWYSEDVYLMNSLTPQESSFPGN